MKLLVVRIKKSKFICYFKDRYKEFLNLQKNTNWLTRKITLTSLFVIFLTFFSLYFNDISDRANTVYFTQIVNSIRFDLDHTGIQNGYNLYSLNHAFSSYLVATLQPVNSTTMYQIIDETNSLPSIQKYYQITASSTEKVNRLIEKYSFKKDFFGSMTRIISGLTILFQIVNFWFVVKLGRLKR